MTKKVLIIDDEQKLALLIKKFLLEIGYDAETVFRAEDGIARALSGSFDLVICDLSLPDKDGLEILKQVKEHITDLPFIIITGHATIEKAFEASRLGASFFIKKPFELEELRILIEKTFEEKSVRKELHFLRKKADGENCLDAIVGTSPGMVKVKKQILDVARFDTSVLITGESGTGKELVARALHYNSSRKTGKFVPINCSAIPETLLESEFFGYMKGAFTGASANKKGIFEEADKGTLLLDEIGDLPVPMQAKVLRAVQEKKIRRLGDNRETEIDVRLLTATAKDLTGLIRDHKFREDLYYRINVINIVLPPLRERKEDIELLLHFFLEKICSRLQLPLKDISPEAVKHVKNHGFTGNVRELENLMERLIIMSGDRPMIEPEPVDSVPFPAADSSAGLEGANFSAPYKEAFEALRLAFDQKYISEALQRNGNNHKKTAEYLGISLRLLQYKLKEMKIAG